MKMGPLNSAHVPVLLIVGCVVLAWADRGAMPDQQILTPAQRLFVQQHPVLRVGISRDWRPFEYVDEQGQHLGLVADYMRLLEQKTGFRLEILRHMPWREAESALTQGRLDLLSGVLWTPDREGRMGFSEPYAAMRLGIVVLKTETDIRDMDDLGDKRVSVVGGHAAHQRLAREHPAMRLLAMDSVDATLRAVDEGRADATVNALSVARDVVQRWYPGRLKVLAPQGRTFQQIHVGIRPDQPQLEAIINAGLAAITKEEHAAIRRKWAGSLAEIKPWWQSPALLVGLLLGFAALGLGLWYRHKQTQSPKPL